MRAPVAAFVKPRLPPLREVQDGYGCAQVTAEKIRKALRARDAQWAQAVERGRGGAFPDSPHGSAPVTQSPRLGQVLPPTTTAPAGAYPNGDSHG